MPYARKFKKRPFQTLRKKKNYRRKKIFKRNFRSKALSTVRVKRNQIVPDRYFCKLKYQVRHATATLNATTSENASIIIRGNSLYDPEYATGGGQPIGFDYLKTLYQYYRVHASKIRMRVYNNASSSNGGAVYLTLYPTTVPASPSTSNTNWADIAGQPHGRYKLTFTASANSTSQKTLTHKIKSRIVLATKSIMNTDHQTSIAQNPAENSLSAPRSWYWIASIWNADQATTTVTYAIDIDMEYYCEFLRPNTMTDTVLYGDPDGTNDPVTSISGTYNYYQPAYGGSGTTSGWVAGPN